MTRLGKHQLQKLIVLGSPTTMQVVACDVSRSLAARGLVQEKEPGAFVGITPAGLRRLADEMEAGRVADALEQMKKQAAERQAARAAFN